MKTKAIDLPERFTGEKLADTIRHIEGAVSGLSMDDCRVFLESEGVESEAFATAMALKQLATQIDVTIHALGILLSLPHILETGETVEYVSLGAGNTGRKFDLETNHRVAEFKFIHWRGGSETIRQNSIFKDFYLLATHTTPKRKHLYVLSTQHVRKFLQGGRALKNILSHNIKLHNMFFEHYGSQYQTVGQYYAEHHNKVEIKDVSQWLPKLS